MLGMLLFLLMVITFSFVFYGTFKFIFRDKIEMQKRIETLVSISDSEEEKSKKNKKNKQKNDFVKKIIYERASKMLDKQKEDSLKKELLEAGKPFNLTPVGFKIVQILLGIFFTVFILIAFLPQTDKIFQIILMSGVSGFFGYIYPTFYLKSKKKQRMLKIQKTMPDFFDMVNVSIEAGLGLDGALNKVSRQMKGPLSDEFIRTLEEVKLGGSKKESFTSLANRIPSDQFKSVINALIQADQMGIGMSKVLRAQTQRIREQRRQEAKEQAMKAPVKMMFPMVIFIFPTLFVVLLGPIIVKLITEWL